MKRVKLIVAYDGTNYHGWQIQPNAVTIESILNQQLSSLLGEEIKVIGASRTDAGVHAMCNVAVFDTYAKMPADKISYALNQKLPEDIRIRSSAEVEADFHPRHCQSIKIYEYKIFNSEFDMPTERLYSYFTHIKLDEALMAEAAAYLVGKHDFKSFCSINTEVEITVRNIHSLNVTREGEMITIRVAGEGFLYNMVRIMVGTLMEAGQNKYLPVHIKDILEAKDRSAAGATAPAKGLTLVSFQIIEE